MRISDLGESGVIARIRRRGLVRAEGVVRGIGDDAAVFRLGQGRVAVVTTDLLLDGVHFVLDRSNPERLGAKALAVNLSDIAAMGARPREAFLSLAAPGSLPVDTLDLFLAGFEAEARRHDVNLLGGDSVASPAGGGLMVSVTVVGDAEEDQVVFRSGARAGDAIHVTGTLGDAAAGLLLLDRGCEGDTDDRRELIERHELPRAYVAEGEWLASSGAVTAMIDLSDGLGCDLGHVAAESGGLGALVHVEAIPLSAALKAVSFELDEEPVDLALGGGEDYRLLVTVRPDRASEVEAAYRARFGEPLWWIGEMEAAAGLRLARGAIVETMVGRGYEHWRA